MVQSQHMLCPEVQTATSELLFELAKAAFDVEPETIQFIDPDWVDRKVRTDKDAFHPVIFDEHKMQLLIQLLSPEKILIETCDLLAFTVKLGLYFPKPAVIVQQFRVLYGFSFQAETVFFAESSWSRFTLGNVF